MIPYDKPITSSRERDTDFLFFCRGITSPPVVRMHANSCELPGSPRNTGNTGTTDRGYISNNRYAARFITYPDRLPGKC